MTKITELQEEMVRDFLRKTPRIKQESGVVFAERLLVAFTTLTEVIVAEGVAAIEKENWGAPATVYEEGFDYGMRVAVKTLQNILKQE